MLPRPHRRSRSCLLHTVKATASHIHEHGGEFVLPVKENRRALPGAPGGLPWGQVPIARNAGVSDHAYKIVCSLYE